ncbi:MAG: potassium channel protein [Ignavibacteriae bacterium]|nr:MAG: potassium channel protein [Ignavibacteriota bacterium]
MNSFYIPVRIFNRFKWAAAMLLFILITGTLGYKYLSNHEHTFIDCLYMTVITISTIGYAEVIDMTGNPAARIFTIFIIFTGVGTSTYILSNITALIVEGDLKESFKRRKMDKIVKKFENHYIICGAGRVGSHIIRELCKTGRAVLVIDNDTATINRICEKYRDVAYVLGDADSEDILMKARIDKAAGIFASTGDDNRNLVISLTAKYINPDVRVVARCLEAVNRKKIQKAGADAVISENYIAGMRMASEMVRPEAAEFLDRMLSDSEKNLRVEEIKLNDKYTGKQIKELCLSEYKNTLLLAIVEGTELVYNPGDEHIISADAKLVVITNPEERNKLEEMNMIDNVG